MQDRFAVRLLSAVKAMGVHTAIETNGFFNARLSDEELKVIDLVILDMKAFTPEQHERVTGIKDNPEVLHFARRLAELKRPMWLRYVLVPGLTDVDAITLSTARLIKNNQLEPDSGWRVILTAALSNLGFKGAIAMALGPRGLAWRVGAAFAVALVAGMSLILFWPGSAAS